jgi:archaellum component FlaC
MNDNKLLNQIGNLIDDKLQPLKKDLKGVKKQLDTVELKVELVNKKVEQSQEETIAALSELISSGYNLHEKRIKKIENHLQISNPQQ